MKNKKGFTLIELLAVIVVLAIIIIIATINVNKQINKTRKKANDINKKMIIKAYKLCSAQELDLSKCDSIPKLISNGYLDEFSDPSVVISGDNITLSKENNKVSYYNYNNTQTFENRFELKFTKDGGDYTCTKVECK